MRSCRPAVAAAAHARYAAAGADRSPRTGRLYAGEPRGLAGRRRRRPAFRARRRDHHGAGVSGAGAEAARPRHPDHCRSRTGLPRAYLCARRSGAQRLGRGRRGSVAHRCGADPEALRQLCLPAPQSRHHAEAPGVRGIRRVDPRRARAAGWREDFLGLCGAARRARWRQGGRGGHCHGARPAARDRPVRRRRARFAGRADHEPAARGGSGGRLRLSRHRPDESPEDPPSRRGR